MAGSQTFTLNIKALFDASDVKAKVGDIQNSFKNLRLPDNLSKNLTDNFASLNKALSEYESRLAKGVNTKADAKGLTASVDNIVKEFTKVENVVSKIQSELGNSVDLSKIIKFDENTINKINQLKTEIADIQKQIVDASKNTGVALNQALSQIKSKGAKNTATKAIELFDNGNIKEAIALLEQAKAKQQALIDAKSKDNKDQPAFNQATRDTAQANINQFDAMITALQNSLTKTSSLTDDLNNKTQTLGNTINKATSEAVQGVDKAKTSLVEYKEKAENARTGVDNLSQSQAQFVREVDQVKSRIQYFFGLTNAINLVKRAIRGAVETVKELDKAMTETAVVTNYTVSDMWKQLPEYTKRANELGVTTKDAYESATLYFQQGLNADQAAALSVETLKMARIAGLDAAEATDRMTNALRGFNMELDTASAQRVDDVYSQLAAMSASNVDEISTAMTKVASLAHNANMEFETTAAFLAQIIETTRESAETAGTALKTVVARFSEVKKLVDEKQLKGKDEEGQVVDVNKVSAALRTAGIDLNKYFLGEVGLDDIFMELASKWDTLTSVQQRYIATQAAGSRQQSRFIALMQDYARTQELVNAAQNSYGASAKQFEKTQESLQSKLARLKNAWNEFLMGLTNNVVIKAVVDGLTTLLNIVNGLTSAFGNGVGSILKWVAALSALGGARALFSNGGLASKAIGGLLGGTAFGNALSNIFGAKPNDAGEVTKARGIFFGQGSLLSTVQNKIKTFKAGSMRDAAGYEAYKQMAEEHMALNPGGKNPYAAEMAYYGAPKTLFGAVGNRFIKTKIGSKLSTGFGAALGKVGVGSGAALGGAATLAATIGTITVAATAAAVAIKKLYDLSPEGQLKQAQKYAKALDDIANTAKQRSKELSQAQEQYNQHNEAVKTASTVSGRNTAIQDRNEYITSLLEQDASYAKYIESVVDESGQFILTLDEAALAKAVEAAGKAANDAAIANRLMAADVNTAQVNVYRSQIDRMQNAGMGITTSAEEQEILKLQSQITGLQQQAKSNISLAAHQMLADSNLASDQVNALADAYAAVFDSQEFRNQLQKQSGVGKFLGRDVWGWISGDLQQEYEALYGAGSSVGKKANEMSLAVTSNKLKQEEQKKLDAATEVINSGNYNKILDAIAGNIDFSEEDMSAATKQLEAFGKALGKDVIEIQKTIRQSQAARQQLKKDRQETVFKQALDSGHQIDDAFFKTIKGLDFDQLGLVSNIVSQAAGQIGEDTLSGLFDQLPNLATDQLKQIQGFFADFNLDEPIRAIDQINTALTKVGGNTAFKTILEDLKTTNASLFDSGNLVQNFLTSESYDNLSDSIEDFIKKNGKISADNIEEMAESCADLDRLLENNIVSAQGLAEAFNLLQDGTVPIDAITSSLLAALGAGESFETLIGNVSKWIKDFDEGTNLTEGTEHITSVAKDALEYVEGWQFGNEPLMNTYDHLFGEGAYDAYMKENWGKKSFDQLEKELGGQLERISSMAEDEGLGALQFLSKKNIGITDKGNNEFSWDLSGFHNAKEAITAVATELGVTDDAARAFIESWASHMWDLRQEWNDLNFDDSMAAFSKAMGDNAVITSQELDALVAQTGKTKDEILKAIGEIRGQGNIPIVVSWQNKNGENLSGQELIDEFNNAATRAGIAKETNITYGAEGRTASYDYSEFAKGFTKTYDEVEGIQGAVDAIDFTALTQHLTDAFKMTPAQASEVANNIAESVDGKFAQTIKVPVEADDGSIKMVEKTLVADSAEGLAANINAELEAADTALLASKLANLDVSSLEKIGTTIEESGVQGVNAIATAIGSLPTEHEVKVTYIEVNRPEKLATGAIIEYNSDAHGGIVKSYAKGSENFHVGAGTALTGEEGPELVWNRDKGYAYVTGEHGPEFQNLQPGDRVFNAEETKKIFAHSLAKGGFIESYASGGWKPSSNKSSSGGGKSGSGGKDKTPEEWKNELDWLYNLMEDIAELERDQKAIEEQYEDALKDQTKTGKDLYNLLVKQLGNLYTQLNHQTFALEKREQEMREFMDITNDKDQYLWYNWQDRTLEIDWDAIDQITDEEEYKHVKELVDEAEEIQDKIDDADDAIMDITNQIQELENIWRDTFTDFEDRVYDAIVKSYQQVIDEYSELNDTLNNSNSQILDSLQKQISLQRQIRDNTKTEEEITDDEARLAYLRRDTSGGNELAALQLEKELSDQRQNYEDTLVDQAINRLQEDNDAAAQQRQQQIDIMQAQLDYQSQNGEFNAYVRELLNSAMGADGELLTNSDLVTLLKQQENWAAMSDVSKEVWDEELNGTFKEVAAFLLKQNAEENGTFYTALTAAVNSVSSAIGSYSQAMVKLGNQISSAGSSGGGGGGGGGSYDYTKSSQSSSWDPKTTVKNSVAQSVANTVAKTVVNTAKSAVSSAFKGISGKFATGGLADMTGLAWLDGSPSEPEYVLNARQTDAFLKLADVLPSMMGSGSNMQTNTFGSTYITMPITLESVNPDYDVNRMVDLLKDKLYDAGSYRNVNSLSFIR